VPWRRTGKVSRAVKGEFSIRLEVDYGTPVQDRENGEHPMRRGDGACGLRGRSSLKSCSPNGIRAETGGLPIGTKRGTTSSLSVNLLPVIGKEG